jgi:predicted transcriptional regulator
MKLRFKLDSENKGLQAFFGELEAEIMEILWDRGPLKGKDIFEAMKDKRKIAYTTVLTVLDRLSRKGFVKKKKKFRSTIFIPTIAKKDFQSLVAQKLVRSAINISNDFAISAFLDIFSEMKSEELEKLSKFIEEKLHGKNKNS